MKLVFLGTSASEGFPNAFCHCANCRRARELGGPSLRKRSAAFVDGELLLDFGPDLMAAAQQHNVSLATVRYCLQTHEHSDHLDLGHFSSRSQFCGVYDTPRLHWFASVGAIDMASAHFEAEHPENRLRNSEVAEKFNLMVHSVKPWQEFNVGPYRVLSVAATHAPGLTAMLYVIERDGRTLFYATDTGELCEETWQALAESGRRFNVVVMDHTFGVAGRSGGHMNCEQFVEQMERMRDEDLLADDARVYATHIGHHSNPPHPELIELGARHGYKIAYDGLTVDV